MAYQLESITMQTEMRPERMADVTALWADIASSRLPLLHKSDGSFMPGLSPVTEFIDYAGVLAGEPCTMRIRTVGPEFYAELKEKVVSNELRLMRTRQTALADALKRPGGRCRKRNSPAVCRLIIHTLRRAPCRRHTRKTERPTAICM